jgi:membrane protease YdiL (CAAX protease family)
MDTRLDRRRIITYIAITFGISWLTALVIALRGGLIDSPEIAPGSGITEAFLLISGVYMFGPLLGHVLTRLFTREGWQDLHLRPNFRRGRLYWLIAWFGTPLLILAGAALYYLVFPQHYDAGLTQLTALLAEFEAASGEPAPFSPAVFAAVQLFQAILISPIINALPILGEEFGWRAYLQQKLMPLGHKKAMIWMGIIWGIWHWPLIWMGHSFGLDYPGAPITGWLVFTWFTFVIGTFLGWATLRGGSVWPAVIGHAVLNGVANAVVLFTVGDPNPLFGPIAAGLMPIIPFSIVALWLLLRGDWREPAAAVEGVG